jgi:hypothetical protein
MERAALMVVRWRMPVRQQDTSGEWIPTKRTRPTKRHVSIDGSKTACGAWIAPDATVLATTADWHLRADCYNCVRRLWRTYRPEGYLAPVNGKDFPLRRACPHWPGRELDPACCRECTTAEDRVIAAIRNSRYVASGSRLAATAAPGLRTVGHAGLPVPI